MIIGTHMMVQSADEAADKAFFRDILKLPHVDAGDGFLLFAIPPSEIAIHEGSGSSHEMFLMCEDIEEFLAEMSEHGIAATPAQNQGWGILSQITLPGGGKLSVYQPQHERPEFGGAKRARRAKRAKRAKKAARRAAKNAGGRKIAKKKKAAKRRAKRR